MNEYEEIVFNDVDGSDNDVYRVERYSYSIYQEPCNNWNDPYFLIESGEYANSIMYDDEIKDIRYVIVFADCGAENYKMRKVSMSYGKSICNTKDFKDYKYTGSLSFHSDQYTYKSFMVYDNNKNIDPEPSKIKLMSMIEKFMNLRAFL